MAKTLNDFLSEGPGWRILVTVAGEEFYSEEARQPNRGRDSTGANYSITFRIPWDILPTSNLGEIQIFNLKPESVALFKRGDPIKLEACYHPFEKHRETVLDGVIESMEVEELSPVTRVLRIQIGDATDVWPVVCVTRQYAPGIQASVVVTDLVDALGMPLENLNPEKDPVYTKGLSLVGPVMPELIMVARRDMASKLHISRSKVHILKTTVGIPSGVVLEGVTGLLKAKPAMSLPDDHKWVNEILGTERPMSYEVTALLTPRLWADSEFEVRSEDPEDLQGMFRAISGEHISTGKHFVTQMRVVEVG